MQTIEKQHIQVMTDVKIVEMSKQGVKLEKGHETLEVEAETIVLALGMKPNNSLIKEIEGKTNIKVIGDALKSRNALEAIREGFLAGAEA